MPRSSRTTFSRPALIETANALDQFCRRMADEEFVAVDTEFIRERTYWPELCVAQIAGAREAAVIDVQSEDISLDPLERLLANQSVLKVFHAGRQDIEIFLHRFGIVPQPIFDTQIAAMVAGFGDQVGYEALVAALTGGTIDKAHRFTDWSLRPLTPAQIAYAAADVTHLHEVYQKLRARLAEDGREPWVAEEMAMLADPATYIIDPETIWTRLRLRTNNRRLLGVLRAVAAWREREAQRINVPRQRLVKDEALAEIAATVPDTVDALSRVRGVSRGFAESRTGEALLEAIAQARGEPEATLPPAPPTRGTVRPSAALVSLLKVLLTAKAEQNHVAARLVANSDDIDRLALEDSPEIPALHGWRREVFGADALALRAGLIALAADGREVKIVSIARS
ncbi:MAG: ribonuclease D [Acetobacteraceae bacterium]|nr:ribonuclease D [Acetobacteraceae bacterium]